MPTGLIAKFVVAGVEVRKVPAKADGAVRVTIGSSSVGGNSAADASIWSPASPAEALASFSVAEADSFRFGSFSFPNESLLRLAAYSSGRESEAF